MSNVTWRTVCALGALVAVAACNTPAPKQAEGCPQGTILRDGNCLPSETADTPTHTADPNPETPSTPSTGSGTATAYDKEAVDSVMNRAARQVKANCGGATDDSGKVTGPWGKTTISVKLGHNGHTRDVNVPPPYGDQPPGKCVVQAFTNLQYPPFAGGDVMIEKDVEIVEPKKH